MGNKCDGCKYGTVAAPQKTCLSCIRNPYCRVDNFEPAEPVVLSAEGIVIGMFPNTEGKRLSDVYQIRISSLYEICNKFHQNGRLERDLELRGLVDAVRLVDWGSGEISFPEDFDAFEVISKQLKNLKPLNQD